MQPAAASATASASAAGVAGAAGAAGAAGVAGAAAVAGQQEPPSTALCRALGAVGEGGAAAAGVVRRPSRGRWRSSVAGRGRLAVVPLHVSRLRVHGGGLAPLSERLKGRRD